MKTQAAIFDIDGTLVDSVDLHAQTWQRVLAEFGQGIPFDKVRAQIGKGADTLLPAFLSAEELRENEAALARRRADLFQDEYLERVRPFAQVRELFERIHGDGIKIALASSSKKAEVAHYQKLLGIDKLVDAATSTDDVKKSKPHPDIFQAALKKLGDNVSPADTLALGDTPYDAEAAGKLGVRTLGLLSGGFPEKSLRQAGAVEIYRDPADLLARYAQSPFCR